MISLKKFDTLKHFLDSSQTFKMKIASVLNSHPHFIEMNEDENWVLNVAAPTAGLTLDHVLKEKDLLRRAIMILQLKPEYSILLTSKKDIQILGKKEIYTLQLAEMIDSNHKKVEEIKLVEKEFDICCGVGEKYGAKLTDFFTELSSYTISLQMRKKASLFQVFNRLTLNNLISYARVCDKFEKFYKKKPIFPAPHKQALPNQLLILLDSIWIEASISPTDPIVEFAFQANSIDSYKKIKSVLVAAFPCDFFVQIKGENVSKLDGYFMVLNQYLNRQILWELGLNDPLLREIID